MSDNKAVLTDEQIDRIARSYFSEEYGQQQVKNAIHDAFQEAAVLASADNPSTAGADICCDCGIRRPLHLLTCSVAEKGMAEGKKKEASEPLRQLLFDLSNNTYFCGLHLGDDAKYAGFLADAEKAEQGLIELFEQVAAPVAQSTAGSVTSLEGFTRYTGKDIALIYSFEGEEFIAVEELESRLAAPVAQSTAGAGSVSVPRSTLEMIYAAMNHMGDILNGMDACEDEDEEATTPAFDAIRALLDNSYLAAPVAQSTAGAAKDTPESMANSNARFAIDGAIQYGRENRNQPPSTDHWLYEYWNIGRQLNEAGRTGWDNVTPLAAPALNPSEVPRPTVPKGFLLVGPGEIRGDFSSFSPKINRAAERLGTLMDEAIDTALKGA